MAPTACAYSIGIIPHWGPRATIVSADRSSDEPEIIIKFGNAKRFFAGTGFSIGESEPHGAIIESRNRALEHGGCPQHTHSDRTMKSHWEWRFSAALSPLPRTCIAMAEVTWSAQGSKRASLGVDNSTAPPMAISLWTDSILTDAS
jgi:hypothetical protein